MLLQVGHHLAQRGDVGAGDLGRALTGTGAELMASDAVRKAYLGG